MLQSLSIRNYAIIDQLSLQPDAHLNILAGETGAGKSIILGALSLILGERADSSVLINKAEKCVVEARFDVAKNKSFREALQLEDLDDEMQCIIRREISTNGKSRAFINDTPVNLAVLNRLSSLLVDLHQQFDHLALRDDSFQLDVLDAIAGNAALLLDYGTAFKTWKAAQAEYDALNQQQQQWQKEADYKQFLFDELEQISFKENEIEAAEVQLKRLNHAEKILSVLEAIRAVMEEGEHPLLNELRKCSQQLNSISEWLPASVPLSERIQAAWLELKDINAELDQLVASVPLDAGQMQQLQERLDMGYKMLKKHGLSGTAELLAFQDKLREELQASQDLTERIAACGRQVASFEEALNTVAGKLSERRKQVAPEMAQQVTGLLGLVGMPNARFEINISPTAHPGHLGADLVTFLLDANKSGQFQPLHRAGSGGEMSRIMLAIKSLIAQAMQLPTLIFDEVDTGISGEAARQVGLLLRRLASYHQVICITHQPQVAARGTKHFFVFKAADASGRMATQVRILSEPERVKAIAQMMGGAHPSEAVIDHARELLEQDNAR
ncbi:MAG: DNA repair protein RecN [Bacteroidetes bacterium]|nr:DNA repair protein RecN [Bacteroidota bacterium]